MPTVRHGWADFPALQAALDTRSAVLEAERRCPITGTPIAAALAAERPRLQPLPAVHELFDCVVARPLAQYLVLLGRIRT